MPRPSLSGSRKTTAKAEAERIAGGKKTTKSSKTAVADRIPVASSPIITATNTGFTTTVPGLVGITPDAVAEMMPLPYLTHSIPLRHYPKSQKPSLIRGWEFMKALNALSN